MTFALEVITTEYKTAGHLVDSAGNAAPGIRPGVEIQTVARAIKDRSNFVVN